MTRGQQLRLRLAGDERLLESDARVAVENRIAAANQPVAFFEDGGHAGNLETALLALGDAAAQQRERLAEEAADEVRLQPPRLGALHLLAHGRHRVWVHALAGELALGDELLDGADVDRAVYFAEQLGLRLGSVAVANGVD